MNPKFYQLYICNETPKGLYFSSSFIDNVIRQVDIMLVSVDIESCGSYIYRLLNMVENSINCCSHIKVHLFDHILKLGKSI